MISLHERVLVYKNGKATAATHPLEVLTKPEVRKIACPRPTPQAMADPVRSSAHSGAFE